MAGGRALAAQLGIEDPSVVRRHAERHRTLYDHAWEIRDAYGNHPYEDAEWAGGSVRSCTGGRGRTPRARRRCTTTRWAGRAVTGSCCPGVRAGVLPHVASPSAARFRA
ncbi:DUF4158 domain-containing protein [Streptomyces sp. M92]|nr:DUF4158 domain-containing protein [Streptomyces sp. M92]WCN05101.1 DUF4158 domain-containing protein [Streptomyces sp. M92]